MTVLAVVQARMTSSRLPGKVLEPLGGRPMILRQLERLKSAKTIDDIVVATSRDTSDDALVRVLEENGWAVERGSLDDVLDRFLGVLQRWPTDAVARITADCPLLSPLVVDTVVRAYLSSGVDYASNTLDPSYPDGLDVEVFSTAALRELVDLDLDDDEREHVTLGLYRRPSRFTLLNVEDSTSDNSSLRWTVDNADDLAFVRWVYDELDVPGGFEYADVLELIARHPERSRTSDHAVRNAALIGKETGVMKGPDS